MSSPAPLPSDSRPDQPSGGLINKGQFWLAFAIGAIVCILPIVIVIYVQIRSQVQERESKILLAKQAEARTREVEEQEKREHYALTRDDVQIPQSAWSSGPTELKWKAKILLETQLSIIQDIAFSPDGKVLAIGANNGELQFWDTVSGERSQVFPAEPHASLAKIVWSPMTRHYLFARTNGCVLRDADSHETVRVFERGSGLGDFSPNGKLVAIPYSFHQQIKFYAIPKGADTRIQPLRLSEAPSANCVLKFATNDHLITHCGEEIGAKPPRTNVRRVSDIHYTKPVTCFAAKRLDRIRLSRDRTLIYHVASVGIFGPGYLQGPFQLGKWQSDESILNFNPRDRALYVAMLSPDGEHLITAENDGTITAWQIRSLLKAYSFEGIKGKASHLIDITPNGRVLAVARLQEVFLFDLDAMKKAGKS